jgi:putative oxidoreductase
MGFLSKIETPAYFFMRLVTGALFAVHGAQKILGFLSSNPPPAMFSQMWFGGIIELGCGALIAVGLLTRLAAFLSSGTMAVAYCQFHWKFVIDDFAWMPAVNEGELAAVYAFVFLFIAAKGAGPIALDRLFRIERA